MDYDSFDMDRKLTKMYDELSESASLLSEHVQFLRDTCYAISAELFEARRAIAKLDQQLNDLRKELADLKKTED